MSRLPSAAAAAADCPSGWRCLWRCRCRPAAPPRAANHQAAGEERDKAAAQTAVPTRMERRPLKRSDRKVRLADPRLR